MDTWSIVQGYADDWIVTVRDETDAPVMTYTGSEPLKATVGPGRSYPATLTLAPTWRSAAAGTITVPITAAQSATLAAGQYLVTVGLADASRAFYEGFLAVEFGVGTDVIPQTYCTYVDMLNLVEWIGKLQTSRQVTGFAPERGRARDWLDNILINRFNYQNMSPTIGQPGFLAMSMFPAAVNTPPSLWLRQQLNAGALVVRNEVIEITARKAISYVCEAQLARLEEQEVELGKRFGRIAEQMVRCLRAELTLNVFNPDNLDTWPSITIDCGTASLRG
jgi:hypothetical protein